VIIDDGAAKALKGGKSLLPAGIVRLEGAFERGDTIRILDQDGNILGQGLSAYNAQDAARLMGHRSHEIEQILGYCGREEIIHRNDLVIN